MRDETRFSFIEKARRVKLGEYLSGALWLKPKCERKAGDRWKNPSITRRNAHQVKPRAKKRVRKQLKLRIINRFAIGAPPEAHSIPSACI